MSNKFYPNLYDEGTYAENHAKPDLPDIEEAGENKNYAPANTVRPQIMDYDGEGDKNEPLQQLYKSLITPIHPVQTILPRNKVMDREAYLSDQTPNPKKRKVKPEERQIILESPTRSSAGEEYPEYFSRKDFHDTTLDRIGQRVATAYMLENHPAEIDLDRRSKVGFWTLQRLERASSKLSKKYRNGCSAVFDKNRPKINRWDIHVTCGEEWSDNAGHIVKFKFIKSGNITKPEKSRVLIACSCPFWVFYGCDFNSRTKDYNERPMYQDQPKGTSAAPTVRGKRNLICKHVAAALPLIRNLRIKKR